MTFVPRPTSLWPLGRELALDETCSWGRKPAEEVLELMVGHGYGGVWIWLFGLLTLVGLVVLVVVAAGAASSTRRSRAREILDARYANGEIGTEEYRARLQALQDH